MDEPTDNRLIVSLTSYPARIATLHLTLETIYAQTRKADEVVLWLAREQFPEGEDELTNELCEFIGEGKLNLRWCDDLKPHKKYFYALQEYEHDLVVTIDDDMLYPEYILENLYQSYLQYPTAVSAIRGHYMVISEKGKVMPYQDWIREVHAVIHEPSMQLFATGVGGVLYPPGIFDKRLFDKQAIINTCLWADDLWLKTMELICDVPVVIVQEFEEMNYIPGSQKEALCHTNMYRNQNDVQWEKINAWVDEHYEKGLLTKKLTETNIGVNLLGIETFCMYLRKQKQVQSEQNRNRVKKLQEENKRLNKELNALEQKNPVLRTLSLIKKKIRRYIGKN